MYVRTRLYQESQVIYNSTLHPGYTKFTYGTRINETTSTALIYSVELPTKYYCIVPSYYY
jgi:hypothetical protein